MKVHSIKVYSNNVNEDCEQKPIYAQECPKFSLLGTQAAQQRLILFLPECADT